MSRHSKRIDTHPLRSKRGGYIIYPDLMLGMVEADRQQYVLNIMYLAKTKTSSPSTEPCDTTGAT